MYVYIKYSLCKKIKGRLIICVIYIYMYMYMYMYEESKIGYQD